jgi:hypothetical protein
VGEKHAGVMSKIIGDSLKCTPSVVFSPFAKTDSPEISLVVVNTTNPVTGRVIEKAKTKLFELTSGFLVATKRIGMPDSRVTYIATGDRIAANRVLIQEECTPGKSW